MKLEQLIKQKRREYPKKFPKLTRTRIGKVLMVYAALPLFSIWALPIGIALCMPMSFSMWTKDKLREVKIRWLLR